MVRAIDPATLPDPEEGVVERARALVRAAAALRGWLLAPTAEADEVYDPYGAPLTFFRSIGDEIQPGPRSRHDGPHRGSRPALSRLRPTPPRTGCADRRRGAPGSGQAARGGPTWI